MGKTRAACSPTERPKRVRVSNGPFVPGWEVGRSALPALPPPVPPASASVPGASEESPQASNQVFVRQLQALAALKREGALTAGEFEVVKKRVVGL